jgi:uncharacterized protein (DUF58 family)
MKSVTAAELAALTAWRGLTTGDRVGGIVFNESEIVDLAPHRSQTQVLRLLHEVARLNQALESGTPASGAVGLNDALDVALRRAHHDHLVVFISDLDGADTDTQRLATLLAAHNDLLVIGIYDPLGACLQPVPGMIADVGDEQVSLPSDSRFPAAFQRAFAQILDHWKEVFHALQVPVLPVSSAEPTVGQLLSLIGQRPTSQ